MRIIFRLWFLRSRRVFFIVYLLFYLLEDLGNEGVIEGREKEFDF